MLPWTYICCHCIIFLQRLLCSTNVIIHFCTHFQVDNRAFKQHASKNIQLDNCENSSDSESNICTCCNSWFCIHLRNSVHYPNVSLLICGFISFQLCWKSICSNEISLKYLIKSWLLWMAHTTLYFELFVVCKLIILLILYSELCEYLWHIWNFDERKAI